MTKKVMAIIMFKEINNYRFKVEILLINIFRLAMTVNFIKLLLLSKMHISLVQTMNQVFAPPPIMTPYVQMI